MLPLFISVAGASPADAQGSRDCLPFERAEWITVPDAFAKVPEEKRRNPAETLVLRHVCKFVNQQATVVFPITPHEDAVLQGDPESGREGILKHSGDTVEQVMLKNLNPGNSEDPDPFRMQHADVACILHLRFR